MTASRDADPAIQIMHLGMAQMPDGLVASRIEQVAIDLADGTWQSRHSANDQRYFWPILSGSVRMP